MPEKDLKDVSRQARDLYEKGRTALERNSLEGAINFFTESVKAEPGFLRARQLLRVAQIKKQKASGGGGISKLFSKVGAAPKLATVNPQKDPAKAMEAAEDALASNPYNTQALRILSEAAEAMGLLQTACFAYETAREASPDDKDILIALAQKYQAVGKPEKAQECFQRVLDMDPSNSEAFKGLKDATANQAMQQGNWEGNYRDNIKDMDEAKSLEQAGRIFKDKDVVQGQMAEIHRLTQEQPDNPTHWRKLGELALLIDDFDYALSSFRYASHLAKDADPNILKAISDTRTKRVTVKVKEQEEILRADPGNASAQQALQELQQEREQIILEECENRAKRYPNDLDIRFELAKSYYRNGMVDKAAAEFQVASNNPKNKVACTNMLGMCFKQKGMLDMAEQRLKSAADQCMVMDALKKEILYNLGLIYEEMGKDETAINQYKSIYDVDIGYKDVGQKIEAYYKKKRG